MEFSREERICPSGSGARQILSAADAQPGVYTFPGNSEQSTTSVFVLLLHPLKYVFVGNHSSGQAGSSVLRTNGKSNWAGALGLLSWPSSSWQHAKEFQNRIFKTTCVD